ERGVVHRDLKPENVFVVPDPDMPSGERVKVIDFGIAKLAEPSGGFQTEAGSLFGTPAYMAPEQCSDAAAVDHRADLYALGCIMYEMLCGLPPFGRGGIELLAAHLRDDPPPLRQRQSSVPTEVDSIVMRLLAKNPDARYQSCDSLGQALDAVTQTLPPELATASTAQSAISASLAAPITEADAATQAASAAEIATTPTAATAPLKPGAVNRDGRTMGSAATVATNAPTEGTPSDPQLITSAPTEAQWAQPNTQRDPVTQTGPERSAADLSMVTAADSGTHVDYSAYESDGSIAPGQKLPADSGSVGRAQRRGLYIAVAAVALVVAGSGIALWQSGEQPSQQVSSGQAQGDAAPVRPRPSRPPPERPVNWDQVLSEVEAALAARQWDDAMVSASRIPDDHPLYEQARELYAQAKNELGNQSRLHAFNDSLDSGEVDAWVRDFRRLAKDESSVYLAEAEEIFDDKREEWLGAQLERAEALSADGKCAKVATIVTRVDGLFPEFAEDFAEVSDKCKGARRRRDKRAREQAAQAEKDKRGARKAIQRMESTKLFKKHKKNLINCLKINNTMRRVSITARVDSTGAVQSVTIPGAPLKVRRCIKDHVKLMPFPPGPADNTLLSYQLDPF
ncbi:MAG: protein kinase, partial [Myxococcota bacterium]